MHAYAASPDTFFLILKNPSVPRKPSKVEMGKGHGERETGPENVWKGQWLVLTVRRKPKRELYMVLAGGGRR